MVYKIDDHLLSVELEEFHSLIEFQLEEQVWEINTFQWTKIFIV